MSEHVYKIIEIAGSSPESIEDAIQNAISKVSKSLHHLRWFEVQETRGHVEAGRVAHYQVVLKVGFTLED
jgi:flavin-binding protein dodecin